MHAVKTICGDDKSNSSDDMVMTELSGYNMLFSKMIHHKHK